MSDIASTTREAHFLKNGGSSTEVLRENEDSSTRSNLTPQTASLRNCASSYVLQTLTADQRATAACFAKLSGWRLTDAFNELKQSQGKEFAVQVLHASNAMRGAQ